MDWRERTYYWVRLNKSGTAWFEKRHDNYGKEYERRVKELRKIPGLRVLPLPSMALAREEREKVPGWAQVLVSCRRAHDKALVNTLESFKAERYGNCNWERVMEPKRGEKRKMKAEEKIEAGDLVRVLDGSGIKDYCGGWTPRMKEYVGRILEVNRAVNELGWKGRGVKLEYGGGYTWDTRGLELVAKGKVQREPETGVEEAKEERSVNKIIIDGKEYELSAELVEKIKAEVAAQEKAENPFARKRADYHYIGSDGTVITTFDAGNNRSDNGRSLVGNYCRDMGLMEQRALHETLNRLLWRYSEEHGGGEKRGGYFIYRSSMEDMRVGHCTYATCGDVYFRKKEVAERAIEEVVKPFLAAHPEFVW